MLSQQMGNSNPGSMSSHGGGSMPQGQDLWTIVRDLEARMGRMQEDYEGRLGRMQSDYEGRISRMQEEIGSLKGQLGEQGRQ